MPTSNMSIPFLHLLFASSRFLSCPLNFHSFPFVSLRLTHPGPQTNRCFLLKPLMEKLSSLKSIGQGGTTQQSKKVTTGNKGQQIKFGLLGNYSELSEIEMESIELKCKAFKSKIQCEFEFSLKLNESKKRGQEEVAKYHSQKGK